MKTLWSLLCPSTLFVVMGRHLEKGAPLAFPVIIVDDNRVISGFKQGAISEALGL